MIQPQISVLVPVYNSAPYLAETIKSVLNQTYKNFELILLNDCSTDNSEEIILSFKDKRIRYYKNEKNLGISPTRNKLIELADKDTKYYAILDNDDICFPQRLEIQKKFLDTHPDISMCGTYFELFNSNKNLSLLKSFIINVGFIWCHPLRPTLKDALKGNVLMHPTAMFRASDLKKYNIAYRAQYSPAEDYDIIKQALFNNLKLANIPQILLKYNLHGDNCSLTQKQKMENADKKIKKEIAEFMHINNYKPYPYFLVMLEKLRLKYFMKDKK
ncbi:MAG: glycosyltransferase family 2 protein [Alphaproteobacteria bacterium]|nr:glycosyltransferase family 2 protein [Alphaproteobacteria bacterium]